MNCSACSAGTSNALISVSGSATVVSVSGPSSAAASASYVFAGSAARLTSFFSPYNWFDQSVGVTGPGYNAGGGYVLLHQHLFWFYSHPAVYIMILPAMGMVSDILSVFARKPIFGYRPMVYAMAGIAFLGFIVWAHHMFQSGMNPTLGTTFAVSTMFIAVPSAIKTLLDKKLIVAKGRKETVGRPMMYGTSKEFLLQFGLKDLSELPSVEDFHDLSGGGS